MTEDEEKYNDIKKSIEDYISVPLSDIRKKATEEDKFQASFVNLIKQMEFLVNRDSESIMVLDVDFSNYNQPFYECIETLMEYSFPNEEIRGLIYFYLYERFDEEGTLIPIYIENREYKVQSPLQLYALVQYVMEVSKK